MSRHSDEGCVDCGDAIDGSAAQVRDLDPATLKERTWTWPLCGPCMNARVAHFSNGKGPRAALRRDA